MNLFYPTPVPHVFQSLCEVIMLLYCWNLLSIRSLEKPDRYCSFWFSVLWKLLSFLNFIEPDSIVGNQYFFHFLILYVTLYVIELELISRVKYWVYYIKWLSAYTLSLLMYTCTPKYNHSLSNLQCMLYFNGNCNNSLGV